ncbi:MAG: hypothetical protein LCH72_06640 [Proteobacteria bacterium]|nr:hypothetical protein [Pseudomonadota bacterium]
MTPANLKPTAATADALAWVDAHRACLGWSARAWARPWRDFVRAYPGLQVADALEVGAGAHSSLAPLLLGLAQRVECSVFDGATLGAVQALNARQLTPAQQARVRHSQQDVLALRGRWALIVLKSVLGGVHRVQRSSLADVHASIARVVSDHLHPGGLLVTLDNGRTALEPLLARAGARRNGWRVFAAGDLPPAEARFSHGVLSVASAATRWGRWGARIDDALAGCDHLLSPWARQHAVHLHVYRRPA